MAMLGLSHTSIGSCPVCKQGVSVEFSVDFRTHWPDGEQPKTDLLLDKGVRVSGMRISHDCTPEVAR